MVQRSNTEASRTGNNQITVKTYKGNFFANYCVLNLQILAQLFADP